MSGKKYVLVTAARNEEDYIEKTIQSVISQTIVPKKWVIVSDGSTDLTDEIAFKYAKKYDFIQFMRIESNKRRNFASQVYAQQAGVKMLKGIKYEFLGMLDADISFETNYYERIMEKCDNNKKIGIVGGWIYESQKGIYKERFGNSIRHVPGAIQMFRRQCYKDINGYIPLRKGGKDSIAEIMARMYGWEVRSFNDIVVLHYRCTGTGKGGILLARFREGEKEYFHRHPIIYEMAKCVYRIGERPYIVGSFFRLCGYCWAFLHRERIFLNDDVLRFLRQEKLDRLYKLLQKKGISSSS